MTLVGPHRSLALALRARYLTAWAILFMLGAVCQLAASNAHAQIDPVAQQQQAIATLDAWRERMLRSPEISIESIDRRLVSAAEAELDQSNRALEALGDWRRAVTGLIRQGKARGLLPDAPGQLALLKRAVQAGVNAGDPGLEALALAEKSRVGVEIGDLGQALTDAARALRLAEASLDPETQAKALDALSDAQSVQGDAFAAVETAQREVAMAGRVADRMTLYWALKSRYRAYITVAQRCRSQPSFDGCFKAVDRAGDDLSSASTIARDLGYTALLKFDETGRDLLWSLRQELLGKKAMAEEQYKNWPYARSAQDVMSVEQIVNIGGGTPSPMLSFLKAESARSDERLNFTPRYLDPEHFAGKAFVAEEEGRHDEALDWYLKAVEALERDRRKIDDERGRSLFLGVRTKIYQSAAMQMLQRKRYGEAFDLMERSRSRVLADMLASRLPQAGNAGVQRLYAEAVATRDRIASRQALMFSAAGLDEARRKDASYLAAERALRDDEAAYEKLLARMAVEAPRLASLTSSQGGDLKALQQAMLDDGFEMLQYMYTLSGLVIWHTSASGSHARSVLVVRAHLVRTLAKLSASLRDPYQPYDERAARELFYLMIEPIKAHIGSNKLLIIPMEEQGNLPFQALIDPADGRFMGEKFQITYAPSGTVLLGLKKTKPLRQASALALADPGLPGVDEEIRSIQRILGGRGVFRADRLPQEAEVKRLASAADVVHLAVHGNFTKDDPMLSFLKMEAGSGDDGKLTATEMFGLSLSRGPLVVLSACETGLAQATPSGETLGMSRALLFAGANALLLSQWRVESEATAHWMQAFYGAMVSSTPAEAAKMASDRLRTDPATRHPYFWAPFLLTAR